jgi:hypothetical protein
LEALSYFVAVIGLPFALWVFIVERRTERLNEEEKVYLQLAGDYENFSSWCSSIRIFA